MDKNWSFKNHNWSAYFIEMIIVIIGISIAFWLEGVQKTKELNNQNISYLEEIQKDLKNDRNELISIIESNEHKLMLLNEGYDLIEAGSPADSISSYISLIGQFKLFEPENLTINSLLQSGDLKIIKPIELKKGLLKLSMDYQKLKFLQDNTLQALDENFFPLLFTHFNLREFQLLDKNFIYDIRIRNYIFFAISETINHIRMSQKTIDQIEEILQQIEHFHSENK